MIMSGQTPTKVTCLPVEAVTGLRGREVANLALQLLLESHGDQNEWSNTLKSHCLPIEAVNGLRGREVAI